ncbi:hypothetical protein BFS16_12055 [Hoylesella timonensis]|uniref:Uncharacterized protein n=2 Tax=Hoylesella timonensis TaxID=386414 RepID=A0A2K0XC15_9BACT|nr:hypothetical protein BFS16_12055 [Hoylesella timonensis]
MIGDGKKIVPVSFYRVMEKTGRKVTYCKCRKCREQCHTPCLGTPQDIERLIDAGYAARLAPTIWAAGIIMGICKKPIYMVQAKAGEEWCTFFHDGLCELHEKGLKPTEGRLSHHSIKADNFHPAKSISWNVAKEWIALENGDCIKRIIEKLEELKI